MSAPAEPAQAADASVPRVLVLGQSPLVLETVLGELGALGVAARGSVHPERAADDFEPGDFDLLALGGGVEAAVREAVKQAFARRNPAIRLLDTHAPVAARQVAEALSLAPADPPVDLDAYGARVGYDGPCEASLSVLRALHERHPDAIPFEAIDVLLGRGVDIAPAAVEAKLIGRRRGGYCHEQNGLFRRVLTACGFQVDGLIARVRWLAPAGARPPGRTHMVLRVMLDGTPWLADVGFGSCVLTEPLRMDTTEPQPTRHDTFRLFPFGVALLLQVWRDGTWLPVYEVFPEPQVQADYELANWYSSTHPDSHFRHGLMVARTAPEARYALRNNRLTVRRPDGETERRRLDADDIEATLRETFGLPVEPAWRPLIERAATAGGED
ncbi:MAG TPA: arylamine N-acetyltransferase [Alphaproteobacteria bacterium]|nr:arylamine N-acetyltransferase [Alphaproteobacteria bacterium]